MKNMYLKMRLKGIREEWDNPSKKRRYFSSISTFFNLTQKGHKNGIVNDKTWSDLDMNSVFSNVDTTISDIGQQYLYRKMRFLEDDDARLIRDFDIAKFLKDDQKTREKLQLQIKSLGNGGASVVANFLFGIFPSIKLPKLPIVMWSLFSLFIIVSSVISSGGYVLAAVAVVVTNFFICQSFEQKTSKFSFGAHHLYKILTASAAIASDKSLSNIPACNDLIKNKTSIRRIKRRLILMSLNQSSEDLIISSIVYLINLVMIYDLLVYAFSIETIRKNIKLLQMGFQSLGNIDASIAIASYINRNPGLCNPIFSDSVSINFVGITHPLVEACVENSFDSKNRSALITGSNMAGKTTFIKMIGINVILARTLWFCHATSAKLPKINVYSSIRNSDQIDEGKSYYFSELEHIKNFLNKLNEGEQCLFLIDEIFRGTNTVERVAGAAAVLQKLAPENIVLVTTHDIELEKHLSNEYEMWYFEETGSRELPFDYRIRSGVCKTKNAIRLMEDMGYPNDIITNARKIASC